MPNVDFLPIIWKVHVSLSQLPRCLSETPLEGFNTDTRTETLA